MTVDETLAQVVALLEHEGADRRSAAAVVLAELAPKDAQTLQALREAVGRADDADLRRHAALAIGEIAPKTIVNDLRLLLKDPEAEVREAVKQVLASGRGVTAADVARMLEAKDDRQRVSAIAVLGAMGSPQARKSILSQLSQGSGRIYEAIVDAMVPLLEALEGADAEAAAEQIAAAMDRELLAKDAKLGQTVVALLAAVGHEAAASPLLDVGASAASVPVRAAAIEALRTAVQGRKPGQRVFKALVDLLENKRTPKALYGPATDTLSVIDVPVDQEPRVRKLLKSEDTVVRRWALRALGRLDSAPAAKALADAVINGDPTDREIALEAAVATANGKNAMARLMSKLEDPERAEVVARGLRPHMESLPEATLRHLEEAALEAPPEVAGVVMGLLNATGSHSADRAHDGLFEKALRLKKDGCYSEAADIFKRMAAGANAEVRYQLGVCELMMSKRKLARGPKKDPCLTTLSVLQRSRDFSLVDRLKKEPGVDEDALYYLGFSLAEGSEDEQGLGGDILMLVAESESGSKLPRMAKNKLVTMGWLE